MQVQAKAVGGVVILGVIAPVVGVSLTTTHRFGYLSASDPGTMYTDTNGVTEAGDGDEVHLWQAGNLTGTFAGNPGFKKPVLRLNSINSTGEASLEMDEVTIPIPSSALMANFTGVTMFAVMKLTSGLAWGTPIGGRFGSDNQFLGNGAIYEWIGMDFRKTTSVTVPLDTWVIYAILGGPVTGTTKLYINDAIAPVYTDTFSNAGFGTTVSIGGTFTNMRGSLATLALYDNELSDADSNANMQSLQAQYAITVTYDARVTMSNGTNHVSAYGPIGSDQVTYIPVHGPSENIIHIAPGSDAAYIQ